MSISFFNSAIFRYVLIPYFSNFLILLPFLVISKKANFPIKLSFTSKEIVYSEVHPFPFCYRWLSSFSHPKLFFFWEWLLHFELFPDQLLDQEFLSLCFYSNPREISSMIWSFWWIIHKSLFSKKHITITKYLVPNINENFLKREFI